MAPLPTTNTARLVIDYNWDGDDHELMLRFATGAAALAATEDVADWLESFVPTKVPTSWTTLGARLYDVGESFSNPVPFPIIAGGASEAGDIYHPLFLSLNGRTSGGRRARVFFYGYTQLTLQADYRFTTGNDAGVDAFRTDFVSMAASIGVVGIDLIAPTWYPYVNQGYNAYWQRQARG